MMAEKGKLKALTLPKLRRLLKKHNGKVKAVAQELGVTDQAIYYWMRTNGCRISNTIVCELEPSPAEAPAGK
jgi:transcriptional regulator with PAS, ATPase and Fis domain